MFCLSRILPLAAVTALSAAVLATPARAFVGYGVEAGTPMYEALQHGYRPGLEAPHDHHAPPPRRGLRRYR